MYKKILVPIAFDHGHNGEAAIKVAKALSAEGAEMILLNVLESIPAYVSAEIPADVFRSVQVDAEARLKQAATIAGAGTQAVVVRGHPGMTIMEYAQKHGIDCIVIASHSPEWTDYLLGSTAARVVRHSPCSVHVVR